jgi:hypothetical protein
MDRANAGDNILGLLIWTYPYQDTLQLSKQALLAKRNEILRRNVRGKDPGSYMTTEKILDPLFDVNKLGNQVFYQLSGLWTVEKGFMGGLLSMSPPLIMPESGL